MTEETKKPKLTLQPRKLSLKKEGGEDVLKQNFAPLKSNTVTVEVKKNQAVDSGRKLSLESARSRFDTGGSSGLTNTEFNQRLNVLKNAEIEALQKQKEAAELELFIQQKVSQDVEQRVEKDIVIAASVEEKVDEQKIQPVVEVKKEKPQESKVDHHQKLSLKPSVVGDKDQTKKSKAEEDEDDKAAKKKVSEPSDVKTKALEKARKLNKATILHMLDSGESDLVKTRSLASIKRAREKEKRKQEQKAQERVFREVILPETISVGELANRMSERAADVTRELMKLGIMANSSQSIDSDTAELIIGTFGHTAKRVYDNKAEDVFDTVVDLEEDLLPRAPVVTVMGHVDHGKTSLLDALKSTDIAAGEEGGITQHIGAYRLQLPSGGAITFIDTPGHEAFTEMRSRGAKATDIVVLVVAGDDGVKAQTIEAINHAKAAEVPIIVAINKMDKPAADSMRVKTELLSHNLVAEDLGGDVMFVEVSALQKKNLDKLEETILLLSEMMELKANPNAEASGVVIESKLDKGVGAVSTLLVQRGTLKTGDIIVAGTSYGRVRTMADSHGKSLKEATPSVPVEVVGLDQAPMAGEKFVVVKNEKQARDVADYREKKYRESERSFAAKMTLEDLFAKASGAGRVKELPLIIKGDVQGSVEAIISSLNKLSLLTDEVMIKILHSASGAISESDVSLAEATGAVILGFNVRTNNNASILAEKSKVDIRYYSIIYDLLNDIKMIMGGMLKPVIREEYLGSVSIRQIFNITKTGKVAGSYVTKGKIKRGAGVRLLRDNVVIHEGKLKTLRRFKEDVKEVSENFECGIAFENYENIQVGDTVEVFDLISEKRVL
jgi:translation initiation factor IF-2